MGHAVLAGRPPRTAAVVVGDFVQLLGAPRRDVIDSVRQEPGDTLHVLPAGDEWSEVRESLIGEGATPYTREAFDWRAFDVARFRDMTVVAPDGVSLLPIDEARAEELLKEAWSRDGVVNFASAADYAERAFGYVAVADGTLVSLAGCFTIYADGIEVEVDTHPRHRRKGYARAVSHALIAEALRRGVAVHWDAMNPESAALARGLGFTNSVRYECLLVERRGRG
jgi:GNAT superfamily N-acetyltransferase